MFGASSKQVDDVEVRTQVTHDLQLWHQSLSLTPPGCGWMVRKRKREGGRENKRTKHTEIRTHCILAKLLIDQLAETRTRLATKLKLSRLLLSLCSQEYGSGVTIFDSYTQETHMALYCVFTSYVLHFNIFTATFVLDWEWVRPYAVASTTLPKAPDPRVRPETQRKAQ